MIVDDVGAALPGASFRSQVDDGAAERAGEFYQLMGGSLSAAAVPGAGVPQGKREVTVWLEPPDGEVAADELLLVAGDGAPLSDSAVLVRAVLRAQPSVAVALVDGRGRVAAQGRVARLRTVAATVAAARRVVGPLAVNALVAGGSPTGAAPLHDGPQVATGSISLARTMADASGYARLAGRLARAAVTVREWACAPVADPPFGQERSELLAPGITLAGPWQNGRTDRFWADPCLVAWSSTSASNVADDNSAENWLFVEELQRRTGMGVIRALRIVDGRLVPGAVVLQSDHHLSFPQVYRVGGRWLATVETCRTRQPIYTFDRLGDPWVEAAELPLLPPGLADPVLLWPPSGLRATSAGDSAGDGAQRLRLVATHAATDPDAVLVEFEFDPLQRRWVPDPGAVRVDVRRSRGGGTLDAASGQRAVQDCSGTYGRAFELTSWPLPAAAPPVDPRRWSGDALRGRSRMKGVHTLTWDTEGRWGTAPAPWIDGWRRRFTPIGGWLRLVERRHSAACDGGSEMADVGSPATALG